MTEARRVRLKNYFGIGRPSQSQYISFANIDWVRLFCIESYLAHS